MENPVLGEEIHHLVTMSQGLVKSTEAEVPPCSYPTKKMTPTLQCLHEPNWPQRVRCTWVKNVEHMVALLQLLPSRVALLRRNREAERPTKHRNFDFLLVVVNVIGLARAQSRQAASAGIKGNLAALPLSPIVGLQPASRSLPPFLSFSRVLLVASKVSTQNRR